MVETILLAAIFLLVYHYVLYPAGVIGLSYVTRSRGIAGEVAAPSFWPKVTLLIAAFNEERVIAAKLQNCFDLDYQGEIEIMVVSDGSTDRTPEIASGFANRGVISMHEAARRGKTAALNRGVAAASGEIVVFSDANNDFNADSIRELVKHFRDLSVGGVCGVKRIRDAEQRESSVGDSMYWRYESAIKLAEGRLGCITNADGEIFAMRKSLYKSIDEGVINDDAEITFDIVRQGYRILYEPAATSTEYASIHIKDDFYVKVRMVAGGYQTMVRYASMLFPPRTWFTFAYFSHKVLRYLAPVLLVIAFVTSAGLSFEPLFLALFLAQVVFYMVAGYGYAKIRHGSLSPVVYVPFYFSAMNLAALVGFWRFISGRQGTNWRKAER
jgi:cellulose synthase/poly-beta-1,6-N-acetylglucosamine synthase-like glycosyltransferase